ncbi:cellulose biosynthesis protein BcsS [Rhodoplanes azumiensis]|uniref:Cellulose biosynthesis protein BcsS n=1 Tax=Rhodoplanes azumiensis TaxID=1897628 RepID=A0ABW5ACV3_9BRAD
MRRSDAGAAVRAAALLGATLFALVVPPAAGAAVAQPEGAVAVSPETLAALEAERLLLFGGTDLWHAGGFLHGGAVWAPEGLARDGPAFKALAGTGTYRYRSGANQVLAVQALGSLTPGWIMRRDRFIASVFGGIDVQHHWTTPPDPGNPLRGTHVGMRLGLDTWWEPFPDTMVRTNATWSSIGHGFGLGAALGWRVLETWYAGFYAGPELQLYGDTNYRQIRIGAHLTGLRRGPWDWSLGFGWVTDTDERAGPSYVRLGVLTKR